MHWKRKVIRDIIDVLKSSSDDSDEEYIKAKYLDKVFWECNFKNVFLQGAILKTSFSEKVVLKNT